MSDTPECEGCQALMDELIDVLQEAFYEIADVDDDGWWDTMGRSEAVHYAERLHKLGVFERDTSRGCGRRQWYRPLKQTNDRPLVCAPPGSAPAFWRGRQSRTQTCQTRKSSNEYAEVVGLLASATRAAMNGSAIKTPLRTAVSASIVSGSPPQFTSGASALPLSQCVHKRTATHAGPL
jgi:hypothetical protein